MSCETNLLKENNKLNEQVKNFSNKLERCYNSKVTFENILKTQRIYGDKCSLGFKEKMTKVKESKKIESFLISCAIGAMKWDILLMVVQTKRSSRR